MKRYLAGIMAAGMAVSVFMAGSVAADEEKVSLKIMQFKTEISDQMNEMAEAYMEEHPNVDLRVESIISDEYETVLKTRFASGDAPDIFNNEGQEKMNLWMEKLEDLSDQPWVDDMLPITTEGITSDGKVYGLPLYLESFAILYNKDLFAEAGIEEVPKTLSAFKEAVEKLEAAGISPLEINGSEWYPNGTFMADVPIAQQENPAAFVAALNDGSEKFVDNQIYQDWTDFLEFYRDHAGQDPLSTDFSGIVSDFASGKTAMILGTNGYQPMIDEINPDFNVGMAPIPINDDEAFNDKIYVSASTYWCVNKDSEVKDAAKEFLTWLVTSETGKKYITEDFAFIPGLSTISANEDAVGQTGIETAEYLAEGKAAGWEWTKYPDGATAELGSLVQMFYAKELDKEGLLEGFQEAWETLLNN